MTIHYIYSITLSQNKYKEIVTVAPLYNVHGDEPSSSEAAMLTAYYLASSEEPEMKDWLANSVILMKPVINPDGRDRHTFWADAN